MHKFFSVRVIVLTFFLVFLGAVGCDRNSGSAQIGSVTAIRSGSLERFKDNGWTALAPGNPLFAADRLRTNENGSAVITLEGVGRFVIGSRTEYVLGNEQKDFASFLHKGSVWVTSLLPKGGRLMIGTMTAVCGVRGTEFSVITDEKGTDLCTCKGIVELMPKNGKALNVSGGEYIVVGNDGLAHETEDGKKLLEEIRKGDVRWYGICVGCHRNEKKAVDVSLEKS